jgi:hypothetical protein
MERYSNLGDAMADTIRTRSVLQGLLADNTTKQISAQRIRDFLVSVIGVLPIQTLSTGSSHTPTLDDCVLIVSSVVNFTLNLPAAATVGWTGKLLLIKKETTSDYTVTIDPNASEAVDGALTLVMVRLHECAMLICDGSNWYII